MVSQNEAGKTLENKTNLVVVDAPDAAECQGDGLLLAGDDDLVLGQARRRDADAGARLLAQLLHQAVVGAGDERVEGLLQGQTLHCTFILVSEEEEEEESIK